MTTPFLEIRSLCKTFGGLVVTDNVSLSLQPGARTALIGPNGAGKTTLVNLITGALAPSKGDILLAGQSIARLPAQERARRGLIRTFQITRLFPSMSVAENLRIAALHRQGLDFALRPSRAAQVRVEAAVAGMLDTLNLRDRTATPVTRLAYGEQRLVELGLSLLMEPRVLLLDEPAAGVPQSESHVIMEAIDRLPPDLAVLFIEHDMDLVFRFATEIVVLVQGAMVARGTPPEIAANPLVKQIYFGEHQP